MLSNHKNYVQNHAFEPQIGPCYGYLEQKVNLYPVFRATRKRMLWYFEQQENSYSGN